MNPIAANRLLEGKRCLIVGGTSGIGLAAARRFLIEGAHIVIAGIDDAQGQSAASDLAAVAECHFVRCDATLPHETDALFTAALQKLGGLDALYHVAGGSGRRFGDGPLHECSDAGWRFTLDLNLTSTFLTNRAAIRRFLAQGAGGAILNLASVLAASPVADYFDTSAYVAAKGGVIALSRQAAAQYAAHGIRVNVLAPGLVDTPAAQRAVGDPAICHYLRTKQPLASGPERPEDIASAAVFLCSSAAQMITGVVLPVDAGWRISDGQIQPTGNG